MGTTAMRARLQRCGGLLLAGALTIGTLAGCGGGANKQAATKTDSAAAQLALLAAVGNAFDGTAETTTFALDGTPAQLGAAINAGRKTPIGDAQLTAIAGSSVTYATASTNGKSLPTAGAGNSNSSLVVTTPSGPAAQIRSLGTAGVLYVRTDLKALGSVLDHAVNTSALQQLSRSGSLSFIGDALNGKWVGLKDLSQLSGLLSLGGLSAASPSAGSAAGMVQQFLVQAARDTTATESGTTNGVTHYTLSARSGTISKDLGNVLLKVPGATLLQSRITALESRLPDKPVTLVASVAAGRLTELDLDLTQLATTKTAGGKAVLTIKLTNDAAAITAPARATVVDASTLLTDASALLNLGTVLGGTGG